MKKIEVDDTLVSVENSEYEGLYSFTKEDFFSLFAKRYPKGKTYKLHGISFDQYVSRGFIGNKKVLDAGFGMNGFLRSLTMAYDKHRSYVLSPEVVWFTIVRQLTELVKADPETYRDLFTLSPEKEKIVLDNALTNSLSYGNVTLEQWITLTKQFETELNKRIPSNVGKVLVPNDLTTIVPVSYAALNIGLMDAASPFYEYGMRTCCGVPSYYINGTQEDWQNIESRARELGELFGTKEPRAKTWLNQAADLIKEISTNEDTTWWKSFVKVDGGSGGPYYNGHFLKLFGVWADDKETVLDLTKIKDCGFHGGVTSDDFLSDFSTVDVQWEYFGNNLDFKFTASISDINYDEKFEGAINPKLSITVWEALS